MEQQICMGCMQPLEEGVAKCPHCGYPNGGINPPEYLRVRTVLSGRYLVGRVLEIGGDGAVYIGYDQQEQSVITLREFFPANLCVRMNDGSLKPLQGQETAFGDYRFKFLSVARAVARLRDVLVIVPTYDIFEENGTAYTVTEFCDGQSLEKYILSRGGRLPTEEVRRLFLPLLSALTTIHGTGLVHLGISPKNVLVDADGQLRLKNFSIPETRTVNTVCRPHLISGYAAPEQYVADAECSTAADVYGVAATMFFALTGRHPTDAQQRSQKAEELMMPAEIADAMPIHIRESLLRALRVNPQRRTQSVQQLLDEMTTTSAVAALIREEEDEAENVPKMVAVKAEKPKSNAKYLWMIFVSTFLVLFLVVAIVLNMFGILVFPWENKGSDRRRDDDDGDDVTTTTSATLPTEPNGTGDKLYTVDDLVGKVFADEVDRALPGGITIVLERVESSSMTQGCIVSQSPAAGERVGQGATIKVVVSSGPVVSEMPNVIGWKEEHARIYLQALGYDVEEESIALQGTELGLDRGCVERTSPAPGEATVYGCKVQLSVVAVGGEPTDAEV